MILCILLTYLLTYTVGEQSLFNPIFRKGNDGPLVTLIFNIEHIQRMSTT